MPAGFALVSTCCHWCHVDSSCSIVTLLATNMWNLLDYLPVHCKTTVDSIQYIVSPMGWSKLIWIKQFNLTVTSPTANSRYGHHLRGESCKICQEHKNNMQHTHVVNNSEVQYCSVTIFRSIWEIMLAGRWQLHQILVAWNTLEHAKLLQQLLESMESES